MDGASACGVTVPTASAPATPACRVTHTGGVTLGPWHHLQTKKPALLLPAPCLPSPLPRPTAQLASARMTHSSPEAPLVPLLPHHPLPSHYSAATCLPSNGATLL